MAQYIYGKNVVMSRLEKGADIEKVFVLEGFKDKKILDKIKCPIEFVKASKLDKIAIHQKTRSKANKQDTVLESNRKVRRLLPQRR